MYIFLNNIYQIHMLATPHMVTNKVFHTTKALIRSMCLNVYLAK